MFIMNNKNDLIQISDKQYNINFVLMILGRIISELGTSIFTFSISLYVLSTTKSAALFTSVLSFSILPNILTNIIGGMVVDCCNKKKLIVGSDLASGAIIFVFLLFFKLYPSNIIIIIIFSMGLSMIQSLFSLTMTSSIANVVKTKQVSKLNSVFTAYGSTISMMGPFLGALVYQNFSMAVIFYINGFSFIISGLLETFIVFYRYNAGEKGEKKNNLIKEYREVFLYLKDTNQVRLLLIINSFLVLVFAPLGAVIVPYVSYNILNVSELQLAVIQGSLAVGALIASLLMTFIPTVNELLKRLYIIIHMQTFGMFLLCLPILFISTDRTKWIVTIFFSGCLVFLGVVGVIRSIPIFAYLQTSVPEQIRGRFFAVQNTSFTFFSFLGMWIYGILLDKILWIYLILASGTASLIVIGFLQLCNREINGVNVEKSEYNP
ncbi:MFS transporter [Iocasia frigidifontis]|uniref:MFS transporter n=2 Tax=Iocasia fonsfrigidae TaxID=2682810 RepID=A0A8A7KC96_9FIRM|nr:MFS transporter [Iocasia fonsfrigidae]